jgi:hypothetical protein
MRVPGLFMSVTAAYSSGRIGDVERNVGIALSGIGCLSAVAVDEPAPRAASDGLPIGDRARLEVVHDERSRLIRRRLAVAPHQKEAQSDECDERGSDSAEVPDSIRGHLAHPLSASRSARSMIDRVRFRSVSDKQQLGLSTTASRLRRAARERAPPVSCSRLMDE